MSPSSLEKFYYDPSLLYHGDFPIREYHYCTKMHELLTTDVASELAPFTSTPISAFKYSSADTMTQRKIMTYIAISEAAMKEKKEAFLAVLAAISDAEKAYYAAESAAMRKEEKLSSFLEHFPTTTPSASSHPGQSNDDMRKIMLLEQVNQSSSQEMIEFQKFEEAVCRQKAAVAAAIVAVAQERSAFIGALAAVLGKEKTSMSRFENKFITKYTTGQPQQSSSNDESLCQELSYSADVPDKAETNIVPSLSIDQEIMDTTLLAKYQTSNCNGLKTKKKRSNLEISKDSGQCSHGISHKPQLSRKSSSNSTPLSKQRLSSGDANAIETITITEDSNDTPSVFSANEIPSASSTETPVIFPTLSSTTESFVEFVSPTIDKAAFDPLAFLQSYEHLFN